tara:strand:+ start:122 stop:349 length:228 start_codon:yes stop_codon:yes gene_type:complete
VAYDPSSKKAKIKRAMLGRLNYKMGKEGDGKDVSHQKDGSVKLEKASKNRGRKGEGGRKKGVPHNYPKKRDSRLN